MKRYDPTIGWKGFAEMAEYSHGEFVRFADVDPLLDQMAAALRPLIEQSAAALNPTRYTDHVCSDGCAAKVSITIGELKSIVAAYEEAKGTT